jgi:secreted trypsin-like serine protease
MEKNVKRVVVHRDYVERTFENDLAILELESPVEFKPYIVPICLPLTSEGDFVGKKAEVTGWGKLSHSEYFWIIIIIHLATRNTVC